MSVYRKTLRDGISITTAFLITVITVTAVFASGIFIGDKYFWNKHKPYSRLQVDLATYKVILATDMNNIDALFGLGWTYYQMGKVMQAKDCYQKILELDPNHDGAHYNMGLVYFQLEEYEHAQKYFNFLIAKYENKHELAYFMLGKTQFALKKFDLAEKNLNISLKINPGSASAHYFLGITQLALGKKEQATASFEAALKYNPEMTEARDELKRLTSFGK